MKDTVKAMLHSQDRDGRHTCQLEECEMLGKVGDNDYILKTPAGVKCHAIFNIFTGYYFADDVFRIVTGEE